jgi:radical SAM protein with 4Fe4S-binding SPASM domain
VHPSRYNLFLKTRDSRYLLFNTFTRSTVIVDSELKNVIEKGGYDKVDPGIVSQLHRCGIIVDGDEFQKVLTLYHKRVNTPFEYEITLIPTYECNLSCYYCKRSGETLSKKTLEKFETFFSRELERTEVGIVALRIGGGEPLLYPHLLETVTILSRTAEEHTRAFFSGLATNGTLVTEDIAETFSAFQVTFEGSRQCHNSVRHDSEGTFDRVMKGAHMILDAGKPLNVRVHVSEESLCSMKDLFDELRSSGVLGSKTLITLAPVMPTRICPFYPGWCTESSEALTVLPEAWKIAQECRIPIKMPSPAYEVLPCQYVTPTSLIVDSCGTFYKCLQAAAERNGAVGSIEEGYQPAHPRKLPGECEMCELLVLCGGGCSWSWRKQKKCEVTHHLLLKRVETHLKREHTIL